MAITGTLDRQVHTATLHMRLGLADSSVRHVSLGLADTSVGQ